MGRRQKGYRFATAARRYDEAVQAFERRGGAIKPGKITLPPDWGDYDYVPTIMLLFKRLVMRHKALKG